MTQSRSSTRNGSPTLADVAMTAGVSPTTASFVLNDTPGQKISQATRERVLEAARVLRYKPNASARALARGHTNEIAVILFETLYLTGLLDWITATQVRALDLGYSPGIYLFQGASRRSIRTFIDGVLERRPVGHHL